MLYHLSLNPRDGLTHIQCSAGMPGLGAVGGTRVPVGSGLCRLWASLAVPAGFEVIMGHHSAAPGPDL